MNHGKRKDEQNANGKPWKVANVRENLPHDFDFLRSIGDGKKSTLIDAAEAFFGFNDAMNDIPRRLRTRLYEEGYRKGLATKSPVKSG